MAERLDGGRDNIIRDSDVVYRPSHEWSISVHEFLKYLHSRGFEKVPSPKGFNVDGQEIMTYVEGDVFNEELPEAVRSDEALIDFAKFIRRFHDLGAEYIERLSGEEKWMLPIQTVVETMCHGDLAPYNTAMKDERVVGLIDFDTLHPGSRLWDISYALYRWIPLMSEENSENFGSELDKSRRVKKFIEAYGTDIVDWDDVFKSVISRLEFLVDFMKQEAGGGDETFEQHIEDGHINGYIKDINYIKHTWANL